MSVCGAVFLVFFLIVCLVLPCIKRRKQKEGLGDLFLLICRIGLSMQLADKVTGPRPAEFPTPEERGGTPRES